MLLAEKLLEGYNGFYGSTTESSIIDPVSYLNETCIEAITALQEAAQQYYVADIIAQSQVIMEGYTGEILTESIGSKAKELWEAFKKKVKQIVNTVVSKFKKFMQWIKEKFTGTQARTKKLQTKIEEKKKASDPKEMEEFIEEFEDDNGFPNVPGLINIIDEHIKFCVDYFVVDEHLGKMDVKRVMNTAMDFAIISDIENGAEYIIDKQSDKNTHRRAKKYLERSFPEFCKESTGMEPSEIYEKVDAFVKKANELPRVSDMSERDVKNIERLLDDVDKCISTYSKSSDFTTDIINGITKLSKQIEAYKVDNAQSPDVQAAITSLSKQISFCTALMNHNLKGTRSVVATCTGVLNQLKA